MRNRSILPGALLALGLMSLAGCDNTQGTSATPEMLHETTAYVDNNNSQNTGAGSGVMLKPQPMTGNRMGGDTPSQAQVKGTNNSNESFPASLTGPGSGRTIEPRRTSPPATPTTPTNSTTTTPTPVPSGMPLGTTPATGASGTSGVTAPPTGTSGTPSAPSGSPP